MVFRASCDPAVIGDDDRHFAVITDHLTHTIADLNERLDALRLADGGGGRRALDRDLEIHETNRRLRVLRRYSWICASDVSSAPTAPSATSAASG